MNGLCRWRKIRVLVGEDRKEKSATSAEHSVNPLFFSKSSATSKALSS